jgi:hypothetical protein
MQAVRDLMAPDRTVCRARIDSVIPSPALGTIRQKIKYIKRSATAIEDAPPQPPRDHLL